MAKGDQLVKWLKPRRPRWIDRKTYDALPEFLTIRECRVRVEQAGFRMKTLIVAVTLLDADEITKSDLAQLDRARWNAELIFRFFKHILCCRHVLSHDQKGIEIPTYCAMITCMLISLWTGRKPTLRTQEMICFYFIGLADEEELLARLTKLKPHAS